MNLGQLKNNIGLVAAIKLNQFIYYGRIIEVAKSFGSKFPFCFYTGVFIQVIIIAKIIFIKKKIYLFATVAAKCFITDLYSIIAGFAAMVAGCLYGCVSYYFPGFIVIVSNYFDVTISFTKKILSIINEKPVALTDINFY